MTKNSLTVAYSQVHCKSIVLLARSPPVVSGLSCIAVRAGRACIGCQRRRPRPSRQKVTPALRRLVRLCPPFVPPVRAATNSSLVTRLICIASAGQWVAQFLHLGRPGPCRGPSAAPWLPAAAAIKNFDQFPSECGRGGAGRDAAPGSSLTLHKKTFTHSTTLKIR